MNGETGTREADREPEVSPAAPVDRVEAYDRLVAAMPKVERMGATTPYTSVNGNMFS